MDDAKAVFDEAKSKGVKGDGFDQIEKKLAVEKNLICIPLKRQKPNEPSENQII